MKLTSEQIRKIVQESIIEENQQLLTESFGFGNMLAYIVRLVPGLFGTLESMGIKMPDKPFSQISYDDILGQGWEERGFLSSTIDQLNIGDILAAGDDDEPESIKNVSSEDFDINWTEDPAKPYLFPVPVGLGFNPSPESDFHRKMITGGRRALEKRTVSGLIDPNSTAKTTKKDRKHTGIDVPVRSNHPIIAMDSGKVIRVINRDDYNKRKRNKENYSGGMYVKISHGNRDFRTASYMHLNKIYVTQGEDVEKGQVIGLSGATGIVTGPHLHLGLNTGGKTNSYDNEEYMDIFDNCVFPAVEKNN